MQNQFNPTPKSNLYLPHIDVIRAIAILSVVLYHAFPNLIPGGFIGVDLFFVISGFLISRNSFISLRSNSFNLIEFYKKRVLRIIPPLLITLTLTTCIGYLVLLPVEFKLLIKHVLGGLTFSNNFLLATESGYFDTSSDVKPLLHLWSLSIEEQFYLFWPILLLVVNKRLHLVVILLIAILSFTISNLRVYYSPSTAFYYLDSRAWELLTGCMLGYFAGSSASRNKSLSLALNTICIILFTTAIFNYDKFLPFPGAMALLPVSLAVGLIIFQNSILNFKPLLIIGKLSYSIYLWHWPILVFAKICGYQDPIDTIGALLLSFLMSLFTEVIVKKITPRNLSLVIIYWIALLPTIYLVFTFGQPLSASSQIDLITKASNDWSYPPTGATVIKKEKVDIVRLGNPNAPQKILFIGDSNMELHADYIMHEISTNHTDTAAWFVTRGGCSPLTDLKRTDGDWCKFQKAATEKLVAEIKFNKVVISSYWYGYYTEPIHYIFQNNDKLFLSKNSQATEIWFSRLKQQAQYLQKEGMTVFIIGNQPVSPLFAPTNIINRKIGINFLSAIKKPVHVRDIAPEVSIINDQLKKIAKTIGANYISPIDILCPNDLCTTWSETDGPLFKDQAHIRPTTAKKYKILKDIFTHN